MVKKSGMEWNGLEDCKVEWFGIVWNGMGWVGWFSQTWGEKGEKMEWIEWFSQMGVHI